MPFSYQAGNNSLLAGYLDEDLMLKKMRENDTRWNYCEVGQANEVSNKIKLADDANLKAGDKLTFYVRGVYSNESV